MILLPGAEFWRLWGVAALLGALAFLAFTAIDAAHATTMRASFYGVESGRVTASGQLFRPMGFTAANWTMPFGTRLSVCFHGCATVTVDDRGPARRLHRDLDLSHGAARAIGLEAIGVGVVDVAVLGRRHAGARRRYR